MCGIAGLVDTGIGANELSRTAGAMADALAHRGPDDRGVWLDEDAGVALGHRRLAIIDLSAAGHQPMLSAGGRYIIVYNGEIYNHAALRRELEDLGVTFQSDSDTEVMLSAIEQWGLRPALERFVGMFAFALWDQKLRELTLVRDRLGIKPLFWGLFGSRFLFGSELKALTAAPNWQGRVDRDALATYMRWNYVPNPHCIYENVFKLAPGHLLVLGQNGTPQLTCWWDARQQTLEAMQRRSDPTDVEAIDAFHKILGEAVQSRMVADVPLGAFLSGGIDSSLIAALMQEHSTKPVRTFTIGFNEDQYNEANFAKTVAQSLGTEHTELYVSPETARDVIPNLAKIHDEPFADSSQIPTFLVSQMTRRDVTVALSGDGGDELFAGYTRYHWANMVQKKFGYFPESVRGLMSGAITSVPGSWWEMAAGILPEKRRPTRIADRAGKLAAFLRQPTALGIYRRQHTHWPMPGDIVPGGLERKGIPWDETLAEDYPSFIESMQIADTLSYLPDDILTKVDRASMAVSLEARVPLLDHRVVDFAWGLPDRFRTRNGKGKWLMRELLSRYVSRDMIERPKMGFSIPMATWLRGPLRDWAEDLLSIDNLSRNDLISPKPVRREWANFLAGHNSSQEALWGILMFQAWQNQWMNAT